MKQNIHYIELLQKALEFELSDIYSYYKEAGLFSRKLVNGERISAQFIEFSQSELRHADIIAVELIKYSVEGSPKLSSVLVSDSIHDSLQKHIVNEAASLAIYQSLLEDTSDKEFSLKLKDIIADEKMHLKKIEHILSRLGKKR